MSKTKQKMQQVSFANVEEFLDFLPADELLIANRLRQIILDNVPDITEKLSYNVPYYKRHKNICFIWPASVLWGNTKTYEGVRLGFANGYLMHDEISYLDKGDRKQVYWRDFTDVNQINVDILKAYLFEALHIDQQLYQQRKPSKKTP